MSTITVKKKPGMKKAFLLIFGILVPITAFPQSPDLYKLVYDSMELTTGGPNVTKTTDLIKGEDYKVILLEVPTGHNGYDVVINFKPKVVVDPTPIMIDNLPNAVINSQLVNTYIPGSPTWTHATVTGHYGGTISYSNVANSYLETKFTGTKIVWITERKSSHDGAWVSIDGGAETLINLKNTIELKQQEVYTSPVLTRGLHTIKVRVAGAGFVVHDAFKVTP